MARILSIAVTQMACSWDRDANIQRAAAMVEEAAGQGAQVVLLQELFETPYFCIDKNKAFLKEATTVAANPAIQAMRVLARKLNVVIPVSFFERDGDRHFNSLAMIDADGEILGVYRKSHIPDFPDYEEAFYFEPGDTGFMVFETKFARLGAAICWDQWFPEAARAMALKGAEVLLYPTAIGWPIEPTQSRFKNSKVHWQQVMQGHAGANIMILAASNRIGAEHGISGQTQFYGGSLIVDHIGTKAAEADEATSQIMVKSFDMDEIALYRKDWGIFRTRRPDLYAPLCLAE
ncbi:nitrilase-related carbon-nitrogen hydrolase [Beijerinckia sp. L45]|uniref:nitrilase-related carbon-nitrogen hydrolase n=1 Tax=Beijerinckia sp. L45 TaxID=1641855 RepID=UPI00131DAA56